MGTRRIRTARRHARAGNAADRTRAGYGPLRSRQPGVDRSNASEDRALTLELQPQRKLHHARTAADQPRGSANRRSHRAAHRRRDLAEVGATLITHGIGKIRVIEQVKQVRPELQPYPFGTEWEVLRRREIEVDQARSIILISPGRAHSPRWRSL